MIHRLRALDQRWVVAVVFVAAMFMSLLDTTIVTVALPTMASDFSVGTTDIEWIVVGYLLSLAVFMPASGWISARFGAKRTFLAALVLFTGASMLCGVAGSLEVLVGFRVLQGVGGGLLMPVGMSMLFRTFPPAERARASRVLVLPTAIAPASGPVLGGILVDQLTWHWIFLVNVPIGIAAFVFGWAFLREQPADHGRFDLAGFVLSGAGLALVLYALDQGSSRGWGTGTVVATGLIGVAALVALVMVELRIDEPMLNLRLFGDRLFRTVTLTSFPAYGAFLGVLFLVPLFLQRVRGLSPTESGLTTFTEALGVIVASQAASRLYPHIGPRRLMAGGLAWTAAVSGGLALVDLDTSIWLVRVAMFALGLGMGFLITSNQAAAFARISSGETPTASAIYSMARQASAAVGVAVLATVLEIRLPDGSDAPPSEVLGAYQAAFLVAAVIAALAVVVAWRVRDEDAAATMVPRSRAAPADEPAVTTAD